MRVAINFLYAALLMVVLFLSFDSRANPPDFLDEISSLTAADVVYGPPSSPRRPVQHCLDPVEQAGFKDECSLSASSDTDTYSIDSFEDLVLSLDSIQQFNIHPSSECCFDTWRFGADSIMNLTSLKDIASLKIKAVEIKPTLLGGLSAFSNLQKLELNQFTFAPLPIEKLSPLLSLQSLSLDKITDAQVPHLLQFTSLVFLHIQGNPKFHITEPSVARLEHLRNLQSLSLPGHHLTGACLEALPSFPSLTALDLSDNKITSSELLPLIKCSQLWFLNITHNPLTDDAILHIAQIPALRTFICQGSPLCSLTDGSIPPLSRASQLTALDLSYNSILSSTEDLLRRIPTLKLIFLKHEHSSESLSSENLGFSADTSLSSLSDTSETPPPFLSSRPHEDLSDTASDLASWRITPLSSRSLSPRG